VSSWAGRGHELDADLNGTMKRQAQHLSYRPGLQQATTPTRTPQPGQRADILRGTTTRWTLARAGASGFQGRFNPYTVASYNGTGPAGCVCSTLAQSRLEPRLPPRRAGLDGPYTDNAPDRPNPTPPSRNRRRGGSSPRHPILNAERCRSGGFSMKAGQAPTRRRRRKGREGTENRRRKDEKETRERGAP